MTTFVNRQHISNFPRLPLKGSIDLTYRCNNACRHCWVCKLPGDRSQKFEMSQNEWIDIIDQARAMGTREWSVSGGEPMLRPDFYEIYEYLTRHANRIALNTNGVYITPKIARLMKKRPGKKMIAIYGATPDVHDHITRRPGSFDAAMRGFAYLHEADVDFIVQIVPMRDNYHQLDDMMTLAKTLGPNWRIGAAWLYLSADRDPLKNAEIKRQRLPAHVAVELDRPTFQADNQEEPGSCQAICDQHLFASCIENRRDFYIDPYGHMSFCSYIRDPQLMADLRKSTFQDIWDNFIPSLMTKIEAQPTYQNECGTCHLRRDCRWCPVYAFLEHGDYSARVDYLCDIAKENRAYKKMWKREHIRYYRIGGLTIQVESELPISNDTFDPDIQKFEVDNPAPDMIKIEHRFSFPKYKQSDLGTKIYKKAPWYIYKSGDHYIYFNVLSPEAGEAIQRIATCNDDHSLCRIYHENDAAFRFGHMQSLTHLASDQLILTRVLTQRQGCYIHAAGLVFHEHGLLFAGHSEAGKTTTVRLFKNRATVLSDDRIIIRQHNSDFHIYGTWNHSDHAEISPGNAPLRAIFFPVQANENRLELITDRRIALKQLLATIIKPMTTPDWWQQIFDLLERITQNVPCYFMHFDKSGEIIDRIDKVVNEEPAQHVDI